MLALGKVHNFKPSPWELWGLNHPKRHSYHIFHHAKQNGYPKILIGQLWEKISVGGGLVALHFNLVT